MLGAADGRRRLHTTAKLVKRSLLKPIAGRRPWLLSRASAPRAQQLQVGEGERAAERCGAGGGQ